MTASSNDTHAAIPPAGPLRGLRVIEICSTVAGPTCTRMMADFGANVIKIEPLQGDPVRQMGRHVGNVSLYAASILRGKKSLALDLKSPEGKEIALALIARADILVENNRPGVMEKLGLGYDVLSKANPGLIMVRISGYGQDGPYAQLPGYGAICEAVAGVRHMTGDPDRPPARVALPTTDALTGVYAAFGASMAIIERSRTGLGQVVDAALYEAAFTQMEQHVPAYEKLQMVPKRVGSNLPTMAPNSLYPTRDSEWILIAANSNPIFKRLALVMQQPALLTDKRFCTIRARGQADNMKAIDALIGAWTVGYDAPALEELLRAAEVPASRVYTIADVYADPHYAARDMLVRVPHTKLGHTTQVGIVPKMSATPGAIRHSGPDIGADSAEVLHSLGIGPDQLAALIARQVVGVGDPGGPIPGKS